MILPRTIYAKLNKILSDVDKKTIILYGPRQAGKTTLMAELKRTLPAEQVISYNGDDLDVQNLLGTPSLDLLKKAVGNYKYLFIDEAQRIPQIGLSLKLLHDNTDTHIIASGSSSFDLANKLSEPLTGRSSIFLLYPFSFGEVPNTPTIPTIRSLGDWLRFGMYPKIVTLENEVEKKDYLNNLLNNYLYKDILAFENIRKPKKIIDLLSLLALQISHEVSIAELATQLKISQPVTEKYLDILEKMFVIINLRGFSRNLRKEITKTSKYYFMDLGLRNALIRNFNPLEQRTDVGEMFENWFIVERMKHLHNFSQYANFYFWRTYDKKEIDLIEERDGQLFGYECKWNASLNYKIPQQWLQAYPNATFTLVDKNNFKKSLR